MKYHLRIYDNYHHADESEAYDHGEFETYDEAETEAKRIVTDSLKNNWSRGKSANILIAEYCMFGESPIILPAKNPKGASFSAIEYANGIAETVARDLEHEQKKTEVQTLYQEAIKFATHKHSERGQKVRGTKMPYVVHLSNVAMEIFMAASHTINFNLIYAIQIALLHDIIEDTSTTLRELQNLFGKDTATAVLALSKNKELSEEEQLSDSLKRIKKLPKEVWAVKLADRITNLQPPPRNWPNKKIIKYMKESQIIFDELHEGNEYLSNRLLAKIQEYRLMNKKYLLDEF